MTIYELRCRAYQRAAYAGQYCLNWAAPALLKGSGCAGELPALLKSKEIARVLLVTDPGLMALGLPAPLLRGLDQAGIFCAVYSATSADPTTKNIEDALRLYHESSCEAIIAFGGGSPMDCAKMVGLRAAYPRRGLNQLKGLRVTLLKSPPPLFAVPTTAGTGSEVTIAAVVTDPDTHQKYTVMTPKVRPRYAVLDPALTVGLPPHITAATGMDALTHAVEAYIGSSNTKSTRQAALRAVRLIFRSLEAAYRDGADLQAREDMLLAAHDAGIAFTRAYVGYVHAIAHAVGGLYHVPHGLACAVALPAVLDYYGEAAHARLAQLADAAGIAGETAAAKARAFIHAIRDMNAALGIPDGFDCLKEQDIPEIARRAIKEANPLYPVPRIMRERDCEAVVRGLKK